MPEQACCFDHCRVDLSSVADALAEGCEPRGETAFSSCRPNEFVPHAADIQAFKRLQEPLRDLLAGCVGAVAEFGGDADEDRFTGVGKRLKAGTEFFDRVVGTGELLVEAVGGFDRFVVAV